MVFLEVEYHPQKDPSITKLIPVVHYYDTTISGHELIGLLARHFGSLEEGNSRRRSQIDQAISVYADSKGDTAFTNIRRYVRVTYTDLLGEEHDEMYLVDGFDVRKLTEAEAKEITSSFERDRPIQIDFFKAISPEEIVGKVLK